MELFAYKIYINNWDDKIPSNYEDGMPDFLNFDNIWNAIITVFCLIVNEDWNQILYTYTRVSKNQAFAYLYIYAVVLIGNFLLLQLFLAILINNFTEASDEARKERLLA